jgi:hypothetical protein
MCSTYEVIPLLARRSIMEAGTVPIIPTSDLVKRLASDQPNLGVNIVKFLRNNRLLHHSALCLGYRIFSQNPIIRKSQAQTKVYMASHLICNAYADAVEHLAAALVESPEHELMFATDSGMSSQRVSVISDCIYAMGLNKTVMLGIVARLRLSLNLPWLDSDVDRMVSTWSTAGLACSEHEGALVRRFLKEAYGLTCDELVEANRLYFQYANCEEEYEFMCSVSGAEWLKDVPFVFDVTQELIDVTLGSAEGADLLPDKA